MTALKPQADCVFCPPHNKLDSGAFEVERHPITIYRTAPRNPVVPGHRLYFPLLHVHDCVQEVQVTAWTVRAALADAKRSFDYFNLIINNGEPAGQTVFHLHVHVVPRGPGEDGVKMPWDHKPDSDMVQMSKKLCDIPQPHGGHCWDYTGPLYWCDGETP